MGMCYVAEDPKQPGAAWAACSAKPEYAKYTARDVARWLRKGAIVQRVDAETARAMLKKWVRPKGAK